MFQRPEAKNRGNNSTIMNNWKNNIMPLCFPRVSYLSLGKKELHCNCVNFYQTTTHTGLSIKSIDILPGEENIIEVMMLTKITGESVKFIEIKSVQETFINMSLQLLQTWIPCSMKTSQVLICANFADWPRSAKISSRRKKNRKIKRRKN